MYAITHGNVFRHGKIRKYGKILINNLYPFGDGLRRRKFCIGMTPEKLKEPYSSGVQVVAGFEDTDVLCIVTLEGFGPS